MKYFLAIYMYIELNKLFMQNILKAIKKTLKIMYLLITETPHNLLQKTTPEYTDPAAIGQTMTL